MRNLQAQIESYLSDYSEKERQYIYRLQQLGQSDVHEENNELKR